MKIKKDVIITTKTDKYLIHRVWYDHVGDLTMIEATTEHRENDEINTFYWLEDFMTLIKIEKLVSIEEI